MRKYYQRKFHLALTLPDGNIYKGFINCNADTKESLHTEDEIKGSFFIERLDEGWNCYFTLDSGDYDRRANGKRGNSDSVVTVGVYRPDRRFPAPASTAEATRVLEYLEPVEYKRIARVYARLEDCITGCETHEW